MPIFEYQCTDCGEPFEKLVFSTAKATEVSCPTCGSTQVKKKISTFASKLSGGGNAFSASSTTSSCSTGGG